MTSVSILCGALRWTLLLLMCVVARPAWAQMTLSPRWTDATPTRDNPLPLEHERLTVTIDEQHATSVFAQRYVNRSAAALEAVCTLRAGEGARVQAFAYWNGEEKIVGEVFEKEAAARVYQETSGRGRDPGLVEQTGEGAFSFRVFPIAPAEQKRLEITVAQRLPRVGRRVQYRAPLASSAAQVGLTLRDSRPLRNIASSTHELELETRGRSMHIIAKPKSARATEFVLDYEIAEAPYSLAVATHQDAGQPAYLTITLGTEQEQVQTPKDVTIVLDHSGSMSGTPLTEARAAAKEVISRLTKKDHVNVIAFDDSMDTLYDAMRPATADGKAEASRFLDAVSDGGGTDIAGALRRALAVQRPGADRPLVLLLTDGESDPKAAFDVVKEDRSNARLFTVGIGQGVNRPLLARLADMKRGRFTYIQSAEAIRSSVTRLFSMVESAAVRGPELHLEGGTLLQMQPSTLPDLAPGEELVVTARALGSGPATLTFTGQGKAGLIKTSARVQLGRTASRPWVGRLWANSRADHVLEDISLEGETDERKTEVVELAIAYGFVTPYTSFLAIPEAELTGTTSELMQDMRERKRAILAKRKDAVALSRSNMPPGDPVLSVKAPADAQRVTAYFPFGLVKELTYDAEQERWRVRFLVPKSVADGQYEVPVVVVTKDGSVQVMKARYVIDSEEPDFDSGATCSAGGMRVEVTSLQPIREVWAALVDAPGKRVRLALASTSSDSLSRGLGKRYLGTLKLPTPDARVRIVVTDDARNESDAVLSCRESE